MAEYDSRTLQRFWSKVDKNGPNGCWIWISSIKSNGYGQFWYAGGMTTPHRMSWRIVNGEIPVGQWTLHRCDIKLCVNPDHLFLGTHQDNMDDMMSKGRSPRTDGKNNGHSKLTHAEVLQIRQSKESHRKIAAKFGIALSHVSRIQTGKAWRETAHEAVQ